eukprot:COSAG01_NODE_38706_length_486_cov_0.826873_1_plen_80_part_10
MNQPPSVHIHTYTHTYITTYIHAHPSPITAGYTVGAIYIMSECFWPAQREMEALEDAVVHSGKKIKVETKVNCTDHGQFI